MKLVYNPKMEGYATLVSDMKELGEITEENPERKNHRPLRTLKYCKKIR